MVEINTRPLRDRPDLESVLRKGFDLIAPAAPGLRYRLVGTGAACLQGVDLPVGDVDLLLARRSDVDAVAAALAHLPCPAPPQWIEATRQYFACYELDGVGFSFSTLEQPCDDDGAVPARPARTAGRPPPAGGILEPPAPYRGRLCIPENGPD
jgi:hypothetical protein